MRKILALSVVAAFLSTTAYAANLLDDVKGAVKDKTGSEAVLSAIGVQPYEAVFCFVKKNDKYTRYHTNEALNGEVKSSDEAVLKIAHDLFAAKDGDKYSYTHDSRSYDAVVVKVDANTVCAVRSAQAAAAAAMPAASASTSSASSTASTPASTEVATTSADAKK